MGGDIETIKQRLEIAEVVGGYVKLEKAGQSFKGRCPFHQEKTPSFFVSPLRQSFYCFGCGEKGDIFTFVEQMEGISFKEALKTLALRAGVELKGRVENQVAKDEKERLREALELALKFFEENLSKKKEAEEYLLSRGLSSETQKSWHLGFAPDEWRALWNHLLALGLKDETLVKAGLVKPVVSGAGKSPYDVFRDRLIFPLFDSQGEVVGFSGRAFSVETEPKYLNTPETLLFLKSELLYGLDRAKGEIRKKNYSVLVEGQMDLVLSHQAGVGNTVASSGTAFTKEHLERLKKLSPRILLAFDGDKAGNLAAWKSAELALSLGLEVKVACLPEGRDPADVIKGNPEEWKEILRQAKPAVEHFLEEILGQEDDRRKALRQVEKKLLPLLALIQSSIERSHFASLIAKRTGVKEEIIWEDLKRVSVRQAPGFKSLTTEEEVKRDTSKIDSVNMRREKYQEVVASLKENPEDPELKKHEAELKKLMRIDELNEEIDNLRLKLAQGDESVVGLVDRLVRERDELKR